MSMSIDEVHKLLSIADLAKQWPHDSGHIAQAALRMLRDHNVVAAKDNADAKKAEEIKAAKVKADAEAKAKAQAEAEAKVAKAAVKPKPEPEPDPEPEAEADPVTRKNVA